MRFESVDELLGCCGARTHVRHGSLIAIEVDVAAPTVVVVCQETTAAEVSLAGDSSRWENEVLGFGGRLTHVRNGGFIAIEVDVAAPTVAAVCQEATAAEVMLAGDSSQWGDKLLCFGGSLTHARIGGLIAIEVDVAAPTVAGVCQEATAAEGNLAGNSSQ